MKKAFWGGVKKLLVILVSILILINTNCFQVYAESDYYTESINMTSSQDNGAMFRWWVVVGDPIDEENMYVYEDELQTIADNGFAGVEVSVLASDGNDLDKNGWGTDTWTNFLLCVFSKADELGLKVDLTVTCGWPISLPEEYLVGTDEDGNAYNYLEQNLYDGEYADVTKTDNDISKTQESGESVTGSIVLHSDAGSEYNATTNEDPLSCRTLQGVVAAKVVGTTYTEKGQQYYVWGSADLTGSDDTKSSTLLDKDSFQVLEEGKDYTLDSSNGSVSIDWEPDETGQYRIFTYWMGFSGASSNKGTSENNYYMDYLNEKAVEQAYEKFIDKTILSNTELASLIQKNGCSLFDDSLEFGSYFGDDNLEWSSVIGKDFDDEFGYSIIQYLPLLEGQSMGGSANVEYYNYEFASYDSTNDNYTYDSSGDSIRRDLSQEYTNLFEEHINTLQNWAHNYNITYRAQDYSFDFDTSYLSAITDYPDVETVGFYDIQTNGEKYDHGDDKCRLVAGGAHVGDKNIISSECGAVNGRAYRMSWEKIMEYEQLQFALGTNRIIFHGCSSTLGTDEWPGYTGFSGLGDSWGARNPSWANGDDDQVAKYISNTQEILQAGNPIIDVAVYNDQYGTYSPIWEDETLEDSGYSYDFLSNNLLKLNSAYVKDGILAPGNGSYKAIIFNNQTYIDVETAEKILQYEAEGLPVIVIGDFPQMPTSYQNYQEEKDQLKEIATQIMQNPNTYKATSESDAVRALEEAGIVPDANPQTDASEGNDLITAHREVGDAQYYYIYNDTKTAVSYSQESNSVGEDGTIYSTEVCEGDDDQETYLGKRVTDTITLKGSGNVFSINLWTGEITQLADYTQNANGTISVDTTLDYNEAIMYAIVPEGENLVGLDQSISSLSQDKMVTISNEEGKKASAVAKDGTVYMKTTENGIYSLKSVSGIDETIEVSELPNILDLSEGYGENKWSLDVESWYGDTTYRYKTAVSDLSKRLNTGEILSVIDQLLALNGTKKKELGTITLDKLAYWSDIATIGKEISGIGTYKLTLNLPEEWNNTDGAMIVMQVKDDAHTSDNKGNENAKLIINDQEVVVDSISFTADVQDLLHAGENTIEIQLDTTLGNALIANRTIEGTWAGEPEIANYGILDITVTPYSYTKILEN